MELVDLGVEFEKETGLALGVEIAGSDLVTQSEGLAVDAAQLLSAGKSCVAGALRSRICIEGAVDLAKACDEPFGRGRFHQVGEAGDAGVDVDFVIVRKRLVVSVVWTCAAAAEGATAQR